MAQAKDETVSITIHGPIKGLKHAAALDSLGSVYLVALAAGVGGDVQQCAAADHGEGDTDQTHHVSGERRAPHLMVDGPSEGNETGAHIAPEVADRAKGDPEPYVGMAAIEEANKREHDDRKNRMRAISGRDRNRLCVVEQVQDVTRIEDHAAEEDSPDRNWQPECTKPNREHEGRKQVPKLVVDAVDHKGSVVGAGLRQSKESDDNPGDHYRRHVRKLLPSWIAPILSRERIGCASID